MSAQDQALLRAVNSLRELREVIRTLEVNDRVILDVSEATAMSEAFKAIQIGLAVLKRDGVDTTAKV